MDDFMLFCGERQDRVKKPPYIDSQASVKWIIGWNILRKFFAGLVKAAWQGNVAVHVGCDYAKEALN